MPRPSSRLDLLIVPENFDSDRCRHLLQRFVRRGILCPDGRPGEGIDQLGLGQLARVWMDAPERPMVYANQQGGFRVRCAGCGCSMVAAYREAVAQWRTRERQEIRCPECGLLTLLRDLDYAPPVAFGRGAVVFSSVSTGLLEPNLRDVLTAELGPFRVVLRRVG